MKICTESPGDIKCTLKDAEMAGGGFQTEQEKKGKKENWETMSELENFYKRLLG